MTTEIPEDQPIEEAETQNSEQEPDAAEAAADGPDTADVVAETAEPAAPSTEEVTEDVSVPEEPVASVADGAEAAEVEVEAPEPEAPSADVADDAVVPAESVEATEESAPELTLGAETDETAAAPKVPVVIRGKIDKHGIAIGTGRRKTAVARVRIREGEGELTINSRPVDEYFNIERDQLSVRAPLEATNTQENVDVWVRVKGGGTTGQAGAIVLGIARALEAMDPQLHEKLSVGGYLTRDGRMVERKKYGYKKARKSFQFSKR